MPVPPQLPEFFYRVVPCMTLLLFDGFRLNKDERKGLQVVKIILTEPVGGAWVAENIQHHKAPAMPVGWPGCMRPEGSVEQANRQL